MFTLEYREEVKWSEEPAWRRSGKVLSRHDGSRPHMNETVPQGPIDQAWETLTTVYRAMLPAFCIVTSLTHIPCPHTYKLTVLCRLCTSQILDQPGTHLHGSPCPDDRTTTTRRNDWRLSLGPKSYCLKFGIVPSTTLKFKTKQCSSVRIANRTKRPF